MSERIVPAEPVLIDWLCNVMGCGEPMYEDGRKPDYTSTPVEIPHRCDNGHTADLPRSYPHQAMRRISREGNR